MTYNKKQRNCMSDRRTNLMPIRGLTYVSLMALALPALAQDNMPAGINSGSDTNRMTSIENRLNTIEEKVPLRLSLGVETLYILADHDESSREKTGNFFADKIEIIASGEFDNGLYYSSRWDYQITQQGFFPAYTYLGYDLSDKWTVQGGVLNQPLGAGVDGSYYDNSFLSDVPLWLGLANNPDMGVKTIFEDDSLELVFSFMKNTEALSSNPNARFRPDVVSQGSINPRGFSGDTFFANVEPINTFGGGGAYTLQLGGDSTLQLGANGQAGDYYNTKTKSDGGDHWAAAAFANYSSGRFGGTFQALTYEHNIKEDPINAPGQTRDSIALSTGALIPANGTVYSSRLSYTMPADLGIYKSVQFYHDYDYLNSGSNDKFTALDTQFNIVGVRLTTGSFYTWISVLTSKNANFANGGPARNDNSWSTQFNIVNSLYF
jgi:hypothetical protein